jgi:excisionase family DNA binding protein
LKDVQTFSIFADYLIIVYTILNSVYFIYITKEISVERLLTTEEVAELFRIDPVTVRRLIGRGELTAYRIAGEYRFTEADLEKFVESQRVIVNVTTKNQVGDKFTDQARNVLGLANEEARRYNHKGVGTEHVLLAIMSESEGIAAKALSQLHVQEKEIRKHIEILHPEEHDRPVAEGMIGLTPQGKASIEWAVQEARGLDHHYLGTEHLLLGLLREEESLGSQVLRQSDVSLEKTRDLIKQLLVTDQTTTASEAEQHGEP